MNENVAPYYNEQQTFEAACLQLQVLVLPSIVLGIAYGRRIIDLDDEMVTFNSKSTLGKYIETFLGQPDSNSIP